MFSHLRKPITLLAAILIGAGLQVGVALAATADLPDGSKLDLSQPCPVCEMKLEASVVGQAAAIFTDGKVVGFDGPGDLLRYYLAPAKYGFDPKNIKHMYVTEYGTKKFIDAKQAFFVVGSDLAGEMGPELAAFSTKEAAEKFKSDHKGKNVVNFAGVTPDDLVSKKKKMKMEHGSGKH
ncbi:MAG: nitrous oxide reductase accessory protein NosL [Desulfomonile sp.]|nr:nitrous oxide reductase accessory protein NosL [Desulfomonile sp.]